MGISSNLIHNIKTCINVLYMYNCIACCISWCVSYNLQTVNERSSAHRSASPPAKAKGETSTIYETSKVRRYEREREREPH